MICEEKNELIGLHYWSTPRPGAVERLDTAEEMCCTFFVRSWQWARVPLPGWLFLWSWTMCFTCLQSISNACTGTSFVRVVITDSIHLKMLVLPNYKYCFICTEVSTKIFVGLGALSSFLFYVHFLLNPLFLLVL